MPFDRLRIRIGGDRAIIRALNRLEKDARGAAADDALRAGARYVRRVMRREAPMGRTGNLRKDVVIKKPAGQRPLSVLWHVAARAQHAYIVGFGTAERFTKAGASRGKQPPNPFASRAADISEGRAKRLMLRRLKKSLLRSAGRR